MFRTRNSAFYLAVLPLAAISALAAVPAASASPAPAGRSAAPPTRLEAVSSQPGAAGASRTRPLSAIQARRLQQGYLVPDQAAYGRAKAAANNATAVGVSLPGPQAPTVMKNFAGISGSNSSPSDSTGAVGTSRYIETTNGGFGIYSRTPSLVSSGTLNSLVGAASADNVFDPQVIWDPGTNRFYYTTDQIRAADGHNLLAIGFSKTASPSTAADFCKYALDYGFSDFPDYPKLGDTLNFWLIGVNVFTGNSFTGSDIIAITKPAGGTTCPAPTTFGVTIKADIKTANGSAAFTPVPANQTDTGGTGYVVARPASIPSTGATSLALYTVTRNTSTGAAVVSAASTIAVPAYKIPADAKQSSSNRLLDTSDTRNTQAVSAVDPRFAKVALWTQHTVLGGAGAQVRWYEINVTAKTLFQSGTVTSATKYVFNGALSPDRRVNGTARAFGANMVLDFNTSSTATFPDIEVVSKVGAGPQSAPTVVITSAGPLQEFNCKTAGSTCRWGDYAAASPDPASLATAATGVVWGSNQYSRDGRVNPGGVNWLTRNFAYQP